MRNRLRRNCLLRNRFLLQRCFDTRKPLFRLFLAPDQASKCLR